MEVQRDYVVNGRGVGCIILAARLAGGTVTKYATAARLAQCMVATSLRKMISESSEE